VRLFIMYGILEDMNSSEKALIVGNPIGSRTLKKVLEHEGIVVSVIENFQEALEQTKVEMPRVILFYVPKYWERVEDFVTEVRKIPELENLKMVYIGDRIEGEEMRILQAYGVKTLTLGPVPPEEMAQFIVKLVNEY